MYQKCRTHQKQVHKMNNRPVTGTDGIARRQVSQSIFCPLKLSETERAFVELDAGVWIPMDARFRKR